MSQRRCICICLFGFFVVFGACAPKKTLDFSKIKPGDKVVNSIGMKLVMIPAGEFEMGFLDLEEKPYQKAFGSPDHDSRVRPAHHVKITKPFFMGVTNVTVGQFREFVRDSGYQTDAEKGCDDEASKSVFVLGAAGNGKGAYGWNAEKGDADYKKDYSWRNPGFQQADDHPVVCVSWDDAVAFCKWLSRKEGKTYRLPTEAEWEYACRAGTSTLFWFANDPEESAKYDNIADASFKSQSPDSITASLAIHANDGFAFTSPVGSFKPNPFGLYDMHGNACQWCSDLFADDYYTHSPVENPQGPKTGTSRIIRGGCWCGHAESQRSNRRTDLPSSFRTMGSGFRVVLEQDK
jgi:formylglycine-generating enzyme required for sulfatase activity